MDRGKKPINACGNAQKHYRVQIGETPFLVSLDEVFGVCGEINLYTYWQGGDTLRTHRT